MSKFYFTFGCGQFHENGYFIIEAETVIKARTKMFSKFGDRWCNHYESAEEAGVEMWGLFLVDYDSDTERAVGELKDLLRVESGLTDNDIKWIEILSLVRGSFSKKEIGIIDDIYVRVM